MTPARTGIVLDHVALAVERWSDAWPRYAVELGGQWSSGGLNVGFAPAQLQYDNGGRVEILQPWQPEDNPFLRRFLDRHGPGPHHLTFKVPDLAAALDRARAAGYTPVGVDLTQPEWMEAFLHPRQATGIVAQMAQSAHAFTSPPPEDFPPRRPGGPAGGFVRATHAVADLAAGLRLFETLLGGRTVARGVTDRGWEYVDLVWSGPPELRLVSPLGAPSDAAPSPLRSWLGSRPGRLHHLAFALDPVPGQPDSVPVGGGDKAWIVPGVLASDRPWRVVEPPDNLGTRLVLVTRPGSLEVE